MARCACGAITRAIFVASETSVGCRGCVGARYTSRARTKRAQAAARTAAVLAKMGASDEMLITDPPPPRPSGRWARTHAKHGALLDARLGRYREQASRARFRALLRGSESGSDLEAIGALYLAVRERIDQLVRLEEERGGHDPLIVKWLRLAAKLLWARASLRSERQVGRWRRR